MCHIFCIFLFLYLEHFFLRTINRFNWNKQNIWYICLSCGQLLKGMKSMTQLNFEENLLTKVAEILILDEPTSTLTT
ncbi:sugar-binding transcriptional regulator, partial [Bacillus sp. B-TM1]